MDRKIRIGLDIGIGSVGWAVLSGEDDRARIEDAGVRIFDSGEVKDGQDRKSQQRRGFRGVRRLERRRHYRKDRLKMHLRNIGLIGNDIADKLTDIVDDDVIALKVKGTKEQLSPAEIYKCLIHTCNHRGYRDFYESDISEKDSKDEAAVNKRAANAFERGFIASECNSVSEYLLKYFHTEDGRLAYRNRNDRKEHLILIRRKLLREEAELLLKKQEEYYPCLTEQNRDAADNIIFSQRDFEDGPGNSNDPHRRYTGFLDSLGSCPFYRGDKRGFRSTVIADVYAVVNSLSQYRYVDITSGEFVLPKQVAEQMIRTLLEDASLGMKTVKSILKAHNIELLKSENSDDKTLTKAVKFLNVARASLEAAGESWTTWISEEQFDPQKPSRLQYISETLSTFQTPSRRKAELKKLPFMTTALSDALMSRKLSGTAGAGYRYMCDAITAFRNGEIYGNFQANTIKKAEEQAKLSSERKLKLTPADIHDEEYMDNPVVFRSINETRKIVNALLECYGAPNTIVVEVASDLNRSYLDRKDIQKQQKEREKQNDKEKAIIEELLGNPPSGIQLEKYRLYKEQEGKCLYSGKPLGELKDILVDDAHVYEVDHIVPFSLILDNTLNNKALAYTAENQAKGQRTPLMYMHPEQAAVFKATVNERYRTKNLTDKKYNYLMLDTIYGERATEILEAWKSRNINDTRAITKYIVALLNQKLQFKGDAAKNVIGVKGSLTSKMRRLWLNKQTWGSEDKNRDSYLNHAVDAVVVANMTPAYIEIALDNNKLMQMYRRYGYRFTEDFKQYLDSCIEKMQKYYHFNPDNARRLLTQQSNIPAYLPSISEEVDIRFNDTDPLKFSRDVCRFYRGNSDFVMMPHMIIASQKQDKKYRGTIADSNPLRIVEIDGVSCKIKRTDIKQLTKADLPKLFTNDMNLRSTLERIFDGRDAKYTVEQYLKENGLNAFRTDVGQSVYKVSLNAGSVSNFYRVEKGENNHTVLGMLKYYCVEVYKNSKGETCTCGVRMIDIVKKEGKLYRKAKSLPQDYQEHKMFLFSNDYIHITKNGKLKFEGFYKSVKSINNSQLYCSYNNASNNDIVHISKDDSFSKISITITGRMGGEIKCSEPLPLIEEIN